MKLSKEEMKKIVDETTEGATHWVVDTECKLPPEYGFDGVDREESAFPLLRWNQIKLDAFIAELTTETPEEKEALDNIKVTKVDDKQSVKIETEHQKEMAEFDWDGEGLPPIGVECEVYGALGKYDEWQKCEVFAIKHCYVFMSNEKEWVVRSKDDVKFRKIETEAEKLERERLESAHELYCIMCAIEGCAKFDLTNFSKTKKDSAVWLAIVDKTNYRNGVE